jgi:hypothetical protein
MGYRVTLNSILRFCRLPASVSIISNRLVRTIPFGQSPGVQSLQHEVGVH